MAEHESYDADYYAANGQDRDRIALWMYERIARRLAPAGAPCLDYGCGAGHFLRRLSGHFAAHGFDLSPDARRLSRQTAPAATVLNDLDEAPDGGFRLVTSLHVLEHVPDPATAVGEIARLLAPGGRLLLVVPDPGGWGRRLKGDRWFAYQDPTHCSLLEVHEWVGHLRAKGLHPLRLRSDGLWDPPYVGGVPRLLQLPTFGAIAAAQVAIGRVVAPAGWGECLVAVAERPADPASVSV